MNEFRLMLGQTQQIYSLNNLPGSQSTLLVYPTFYGVFYVDFGWDSQFTQHKLMDLNHLKSVKSFKQYRVKSVEERKVIHIIHRQWYVMPTHRA